MPVSKEQKNCMTDLRPVLIIYTHLYILPLILILTAYCFPLLPPPHFFCLFFFFCYTRFKLQAMLQNPSKSVISKTECFSLLVITTGLA
jgi:hypothetical protein